MILLNRNLNVLSDINFEIVEGNILDKDLLQKGMGVCCFVIHLAVLTTVRPRRSKLEITFNFEDINDVLETA